MVEHGDYEMNCTLSLLPLLRPCNILCFQVLLSWVSIATAQIVATDVQIANTLVQSCRKGMIIRDVSTDRADIVFAILSKDKNRVELKIDKRLAASALDRIQATVERLPTDQAKRVGLCLSPATRALKLSVTQQQLPVAQERQGPIQQEQERMARERNDARIVIVERLGSASAAPPQSASGSTISASAAPPRSASAAPAPPVIMESSASSPLASASTGTKLVPVRAYLHASAIPPPQVAAYGVVAFRAKPTAASRDRLVRVCAAYTAHLPRSESLPTSVSITDRMLTVWPLEDPGATEATKDDCKFAVDHYDLYGGISAIQDAQRQGGTLDGRGPFLIGWSPSSSRGVPDKVVLVVDLSSFESQDSFDNAFLFWQKKIVEDPMLWRSGFSIERLRLAIRDFVDHYGQDVMKATKILGIKN